MKVIAHVDMDAFYTQVEIGRDPGRLAGQPVVVIQYNPFGDLSTEKPEDDRIKPDSNGSIIAVSYEARKYGVKRNMMAQQAKKLCPALKIVQVPVAHGKSDLTIYRDAGAAVINVLSKSAVCERASIDEGYLDVTAAAQRLLAGAALPPKHSSASNNSSRAAAAAAAAGASAADADEQAAAMVAAAEAAEAAEDEVQEMHEGGVSLGGAAAVLPLPESFEGWHVAGVEPSGPDSVRDWWCRPALAWDQSDALLAAGAHVVAKARAAVKASLGYSCSAGIAHSKILAKLGSGLNKPAQQTVVPAAAVAGLLAPLPVSKLRQLGGKFGEEIQAKLNVSTVGELAAVPLSRLEAVLSEQDAAWLHRLAQGKDGEEVVPRMLPKSISCGKTFRNQNVLTGLTAVHQWLLQLGQELQERIQADRQQHQRLPKLLTVSFDSAPVEEAGPSDSAGVASKPAAASAAGSSGSGSNGQPAAARMTAQNWRAGATNISRSCALRHARAEVIAADALGLVKKWARDRPNGFRIVTMFVSASNFSIAPTGASTLERFFSGPAAAAAKVGKAPAAQQEQHQQQQQQSQHPEGLVTGSDSNALGSAAGERPQGSTTAVRLTGIKRQGSYCGKQGKAARVDKHQGSLRGFLSATPALEQQQQPTLAAPAGLVQHSAGAAGASGTAAASGLRQPVCAAETDRSGGGRAGSEGGWGVAPGGDWCPTVAESGVDAGVYCSSGSTAGAVYRGTDAAVQVAAGLPMPAATSAAAAGCFAAPLTVPGYKPVSPARPALSALQLLRPAVPGAAVLPAGLAGLAGQQQCSTQPPMQLSTDPPPAPGPTLPAQHHAFLPAAATAHSDMTCTASAQTVLHGGACCLQQGPGSEAVPGPPRGPVQDMSAHRAPCTAQQDGDNSIIQQGLAQSQGAEPPVPSLHAWLGSGQEEAGVSGNGLEQASHQQLRSTTQGQPQPEQLQQGQAAVTSVAVQQPQLQEGIQEQVQLPGVSTQQLQEELQRPQQPYVQGLGAVPLQLSDIDPEVLAALPWDIQMEVQQQLRARRGGGGRAAAPGRRGSRGAARGRAGGAGGRRQQAQDQGSILTYLRK